MIDKCKRKQLLIVLGMHRSGTSAITRGLQVLGASIGENLMPPAQGNNEKGFFEDLDINSFNIDALHTIGHSWYQLASIDTMDMDRLRASGYHLRAVELLRAKVKDHNIFAFKDPRVSRLLPIWREAAEHLQLDLSYVIALRHPLSVARSLAKRDEFTQGLGYWLWLGHVLDGLRGSEGQPRVVVDYDLLLEAPEQQLSRVADLFNLKVNAAQLDEYKNEFLDIKLRHTTYSSDDLLLDAACPPIVREVYEGLLGVAIGPDSTFSPTLTNDISRWFVEFERMKSSFELVDLQLQQIAMLNQTAAKRDGQIATLNQTVAERDGQIATLNQTVAERDGQIATLNQTVAERDGQIAALNHTSAERDEQISDLSQTVAQTDGQIGSLSEGWADRDEQIARLSRELAAHSALIAEIRKSLSWRLTYPLRLVATPLVAMARKATMIRVVAARNGGVKNTALTAISLWRNHGTSSLIRAVKQALKPMQPQLMPATMAPLLGNAGTSNELGPPHDRNDYTEWVRRYDTLTDADRRRMRAIQVSFHAQPLVSVVMPTYNPKPEWLIEAIESVRKQIYPHWELCIADDASTNAKIRPILERYAAQDQRIKVVFREKNGHISAATNSALELVTGQWVALLDHDDLLSEHALFWVVDAINCNPDARLVYSDEDKISESGKRFGPYFKCEWNRDLFYSHNMICHLGVYQADLIKKIGGFRLGFEGSQDYDLALRFIETIAEHQICHIPRVLYHWRVHQQSTAMAADAKPYAMIAGQHAIGEHLVRTGCSAKVALIGHGYRVDYEITPTNPLVSIIIPTRNGKVLLKQCLDSIIRKTTYRQYEIIIVDNGSDDNDTLNYLSGLESSAGIRVIRDARPFNYSQLNNLAASSARGSLLALLNNDVEVITPDWLTHMVAHAMRPGVGAVGAKLWYSNNLLQHGGVILGIGGYAGHAHKHFPRDSLGYSGRMTLVQNVSAVTGACLVVQKKLFDAVGGLDEENLAIACNDVDLCLRLREQGYRNIWTPFAELYHHESATRGYEDTPEKLERFNRELAYMKKRWGGQLLNDPAYSPNLTLDLEDFSYAWPPRVVGI